MMTIQKPKRMWQKKKDYMRKKTIRGLRRKGKRILQSFDDGTDDIRKQIEVDFPSAKAFGTILPDYTIVADPTFTKDKTGAGEIEYFNEPEITYANGYRKANPAKGPSLVYNPNSQTEEDIKLDLLHHYREYDPVYQDLLKDYTDTQDPGQILYNSELGEYFRNLPKEQQTNENWNKLVKQNLNSQYMVQGIDGSLRGLMASDKLRSLGRYPNRTIYEKENLNSNAARLAYQNIVNYLTSERLPEVIIKPKRYKKGKDCFDIGTDDGQQMIYQDGDQYFAGPNINAATTKVTPYIQRLPNDKSTWDFIDDSGKLYTTKYSDDQLKQLYSQNTPESEFYNWIDRSGKEHRQMKIIPVSPVDPVGEMVVETALGAPLFKGAGMIGKQFLKDYARDFAFTKLGNWTRNKIASKEAADILNKNVSMWDGTVGPEYFNSPYNWYRWTETPEIQSLKRYGKNITTHDDDYIVGTPNSWRTNAMDTFSKSKEGYWYKADNFPDDDSFKAYTDYLNNPNKTIGFGNKYGSAHGNRSQASYGKYWDGSLSTSGIGHLGLLEGDTGPTIPFGITRKHFVEKPIEDIIPGTRTGFKTGEMPMGNLSWFEKLPNGRFDYKGLVLPDKRIDLTPRFNFKKVFHQPRMQFNEPTYQMYTGRRFNISDIINKDKSINIDKLKEAYREALKNIPNGYTPQHRLENTKWHKTDWNTFLHSRDAYRRALEFNYPDEALFPTLMHDAGKLWAGDGHGPYGASIIRQMFPDATDEQIMAIYGHMTQEPYGTLGNLVKGADIHIPNKWRDLGLQQLQNHNSGKDIHIKKANRGKFTEAANEHNMGVQEFARQVLSAPKGKYSSTLRKRANFARNFAH